MLSILDIYGAAHKFFERLYFPSFRIKYSNEASKTIPKHISASSSLISPISLLLYLSLDGNKISDEFYSYILLSVIVIIFTAIDYTVYYCFGFDKKFEFRYNTICKPKAIIAELIGVSLFVYPLILFLILGD